MPSIAHLLYIPGVFLFGLALGFRLGAKAARQEWQRHEQQRKR
ncbi:MAG: hypothetical protein ACPGUV_11225 [Polyangiales bacterium]